MSKGRILYELEKTIKEIGVIHEQKILMFQNEDSESDAESMMLNQKEEKIKQVTEILPEISSDLASFALTKNGDDVTLAIASLSEGSLTFYKEELNMIEKRKREIMKGSPEQKVNETEMKNFVEMLSNYEVLYDMIFKLMKLNNLDLNDILWKLLHILPLSQKAKHHILMKTQNLEDLGAIEDRGMHSENQEAVLEQDAWKFHTESLVENPKSYTACYQLYVLCQIVRETKNVLVIEWLLFEENLLTMTNIYSNPEIVVLFENFQESESPVSRDLVNIFRFIGSLLVMLNSLNQMFIKTTSYTCRISQSDMITMMLHKEIDNEERSGLDSRERLFEDYKAVYEQILESTGFIVNLKSMLTMLIKQYNNYSNEVEADIYKELIENSFEFISSMERDSGEKKLMLSMIQELIAAIGKYSGQKNILFLNIIYYYGSLFDFEGVLIKHLIEEIRNERLEGMSQVKQKIEIVRELIEFLEVKRKRKPIETNEMIRLLMDLKGVFENIERKNEAECGEDCVTVCNEIFACMRYVLRLLDTNIPNIREDFTLIGFYEDFLERNLIEMFSKPEGFFYSLIVDSESRVKSALFEMIETFSLHSKLRVVNLLQTLRKIYQPDDFKSSQMNFVDVRKKKSYIGIKNLGCTCYANSLLQQIFHNKKIRDFIASVPISISSDSPSVLRELKLLFAQLSLGKMSQAELLNFTRVFTGFDNMPINVKVQQDVNEFFNLLLDTIENELRDLGLEVEDAFHTELGGTFYNEITSFDPQFEYHATNEERYNTLSLDVKNTTSIQEALDKFFRTEIFDGDNKLFIDKYNTKIEVKKNCSLNRELPSTMAIMLKRFEYDQATYTRIKLNDYFEFPFELNLGRWVKGSTEDNMNLVEDSRPFRYHLKGVLVHSGTSEMGHYYSYILLNGKWIEFNDTKVAVFDPTDKNLKKEWYGGEDEARGISGFSKNSRSAYMLFYEKDAGENGENPGTGVSEEKYSSEVISMMEEQNKSFLRKKVYSDSSTLRFINELLSKLDYEEGIEYLAELLVDKEKEVVKDQELFDFLKNLKSIVLQKLACRHDLLKDICKEENNYQILPAQGPQEPGEPFVAFDYGAFDYGVFGDLVDRDADKSFGSNKACNGYMFDSLDEETCQESKNKLNIKIEVHKYNANGEKQEDEQNDGNEAIEKILEDFM